AAKDGSTAGLTVILSLSPPAGAFDSVSLHSGFGTSLNGVHSPNTCPGVTVAALMGAWVRMKNSPSPLRSASYMCASTSMKSRTTAPLAFKSRTESLGPMVQTTTSFSAGNAVPQTSSRSSLKPPAAGSRLKVTGQVLSRAALEISQAPAISFAASLGAGACALAVAPDSASAITAKQARGGMGNPTKAAVADAITMWRTRHVLPKLRRTALRVVHTRNLRVPMRRSCALAGAHACFRCFGGHGVSVTGVSGGLPAAQAKRLSTTSWSIFSRVATDAEPRWGNNTT